MSRNLMLPQNEYPQPRTRSSSGASHTAINIKAQQQQNTITNNKRVRIPFMNLSSFFSNLKNTRTSLGKEPVVSPMSLQVSDSDLDDSRSEQLSSSSDCEIFLGDSSNKNTTKNHHQNGDAHILLNAIDSMLDPSSDDESTDSINICYKRLLFIPMLFLINLAIILIFYIPLRSILGLGMLWNFQELKQTLSVIEENIDDSGFNVYIPLMALYSSIYIFIQTFCIPGSILLNCLAGAIFGTFTGTALCSLLTAAGSTLVYIMCKWIGEEMVLFWFGKKIGKLNRNIEQMSILQRFFYLLALRTFPLTPQYLLNLASPIIGIDMWMFLLSMMVGLLPFHIVTVRTGRIITQIHSSKDILQTDTCILLGLLSVLLLAPPIIKRSKLLQKYFNISL
mmetsp:Transcript_10871/g.40556  ORF Transcript_10871/g.40556 Transcript_10871/m.40556 type:complete len:393 (-) Transcript_10871:193-1371(-)|eukprot:CAMPEP_0117444084 /NCGR_PEP_ID=MMETSP0759-20121206/5046_1 /TAXON_ID=63605 /ORGANISM="Percolomonas cosmopolitus, Strain WS" /LENGTH=392 /DNA_ID=CAMNT_0005236115 /DNA_START=398 /DNA_END=1576 /DNA_ORIENTATION=+